MNPTTRSKKEARSFGFEMATNHVTMVDKAVAHAIHVQIERTRLKFLAACGKTLTAGQSGFLGGEPTWNLTSGDDLTQVEESFLVIFWNGYTEALAAVTQMQRDDRNGRNRR